MTPLERQILFDIAMRVGRGLELEPMLRDSLSIMLRQLGCVAGAVFKWRSDHPDKMALVQHIPQQGLPLQFLQHVRQALLPWIAAHEETDPPPKVITLLLQNEGTAPLHLHIYNLPHFGTLALLRPGAPLSYPLQQSLIPIAEQLAQACLSHDRFQTIQAIQSELQLERERAQAALLALSDSVISLSPEGCIQLLNPAAERLLGVKQQEALGQDITNVLKVRNELDGQLIDLKDLLGLGHDRPPAESLQNQRVLLDQGPRIGSILELSLSPIQAMDTTKRGMVIVLRDITTEVETQRTLEWEATHDMLTDLANRRAFAHRLEQLFRSAHTEARQHALIVFDLDHFKVLNDSEGHAAGDELLRQVALLINTQTRASDIAARLGGDDFALLLADCPLERAETLARNLTEAIAKIRFYWNGRPHPVSVSAGIVSIDSDTVSPQEALSDADTACYAAKEKGRNQVLVYRPGDADLSRRKATLAWITTLEHALSNGRFCLMAQPIRPVSLTTDKEHYEILLRLNDPGSALITPESFILAAERYDLMSRIDRWVVEEVFASLHHAPEHISVAINLSGQSISDQRFEDFLQQKVHDSQLNPERICFEITETAAINNFIRAQHFMKTFHGLGFRFALDDFGTGMSSFAYLKNLPVDMLKIDGSFIRHVDQDATDRVMVEAITRVGKVMGIPTVAEYVERPEILATLREIGVDYVQGWMIGRPRAVREILPTLK
ncbi:MAG: EAL domain-containing protein [Gammaproteobacteria bacterium]|nr:EAL domain-containing protein [Gammaproteobacteria bacterium]